MIVVSAVVVVKMDILGIYQAKIGGSHSWLALGEMASKAVEGVHALLLSCPPYFLYRLVQYY
jgi:hypothetical protein